MALRDRDGWPGSVGIRELVVQFLEPLDIEDAVRSLAQTPAAACLAGGAVLVARLNQHAIAPTGLVSLRKVEALRRLALGADGTAVIGAMVTHARVAAAAGLAGGHAVVRDAAAQIAHPPIRSMATIGGSLADAHPQADYPCALLAAGAAIALIGPAGPRLLPIDAFVLDPFTTALAAGEIIEAVHLAPREAEEGGAYIKFSRVDGDYATASVGVRLRLENGVCAAIRIAVGGCGPRPYRVAAAEQGLLGAALADAAIARVAPLYVEASAPRDDVKATAAYRRMLIPTLLRRAIRKAVDRATGIS